MSEHTDPSEWEKTAQVRFALRDRSQELRRDIACTLSALRENDQAWFEYEVNRLCEMAACMAIHNVGVQEGDDA